MKYRLKKVAVLGSGVMGSGIACHLANVGMDVLMLDIVTPNLRGAQSKDPVHRNMLVNTALQKAIKSKPAAFYHNSFASRIRTGNFEDDFDQIADADWIIEVVVENLADQKADF
jgi:3-hydroxyacyl-CoA dehydrogenase